MKNYLYIPLGGNRMGKVRTFLNLWLVFLVSGLWHGAGWNFIFWGGWHGMFLIFEKGIGENRLVKIPFVLRWIYTIFVVFVGWVFFRADTLQHAREYLKIMFSFTSHNGKFAMQNDFPALAVTGMFFSLFVLLPKGKHWQEWWWGVDMIYEKFFLRLVLCAVLYLMSLSFLTTMNFNPFIYFRF